MIPAWQAAHFNALHQARITHCLRTIPGRAYPVPEGELLVWIRAQQEYKRKLERDRKAAARARAESAFA